MNKTLASIVVIAIIALIFFAVAAYTLSEASPQLRVKRTIERALPAKVEGVERVSEPGVRRTLLRIRAVPLGVSPTADLLETIAARAVAALESIDAIQTDYDALEVVVPGGPSARFEKFALERRAHFERRLTELAAALKRKWAAVPRLELREERNAFGVALAARPPGSRDDAAIAADIFSAEPGRVFAFVVVPAKEAGAAPAKIRR